MANNFSSGKLDVTNYAASLKEIVAILTNKQLVVLDLLAEIYGLIKYFTNTGLYYF